MNRSSVLTQGQANMQLNDASSFYHREAYITTNLINIHCLYFMTLMHSGALSE